MRRLLQRGGAEIDPLAYSADGRSFNFEAPLRLPLPVGSYVLLEDEEGRSYLGQVLQKEIINRDGAQVSLELDDDVDQTIDGGRVAGVSARVKLRYVQGTGDLLVRVDGEKMSGTRPTDVFRDADLTAAGAELVSAYLGGRDSSQARLEIGITEIAGAQAPATMRPKGFGRHTFLCGQSGSGKTFALGVLLEQLLLETDLRLLVIDPNGDFSRLGELQTNAAINSTRANPYGRTELADVRRRYKEAASRVQLLGARAEHGADPLRIRFSELGPEAQGAVLKLDPLADREEFSAYWRFIETLPGTRYSLADVRAFSGGVLTEHARQIALRIENLGVADWDLWASADEPSLVDTLDSDWRALVVDISDLAHAEEQAVTVTTILEHLWRRREDRNPVLVAIDEAHTVCPAEPTSKLQEASAAHVVRIAGEGRKYGLHLLVATQRPAKIHPNVLSQCDNLVLMRMNSAADLAGIAETFSFAPESMLAQAPYFDQGETLLAGGIVNRPTVARFGGRLSPEGGGDVPATWA